MTSAQISGRIADVLARAGGVRHAVLSPGTRNAPLLVAFEENGDIDCLTVIDERSAAFVGLGIAGCTGAPVALVCTSGTAPLNYAPAIAEAFYRHVPLIALTADRPASWIDQDDSQTIHQPGIFANFIKAQYDIPVGADDRLVRRVMLDAVGCAASYPPGPVHINVQIDNPADTACPVLSTEDFPMAYSCGAPPVNEQAVKDLAAMINDGRKVMIISGFSDVDDGLKAAVSRLSRHGNVAVAAEPCSNLSLRDIVYNVDVTLSIAGDEPGYVPDVVVTVGGALVSGALKSWLRRHPGIRLFSVTATSTVVDCYGAVYRHVQCRPSDFFTLVAENVPQVIPGAFKDLWLNTSQRAAALTASYLDEDRWSAQKAFEAIMSRLPEGVNLQLSNGMAVRYASLCDWRKMGSVGCNRGVSGIDGCTSTAIGYAMASPTPTVLISGDMSMQYDVNALSIRGIPDTMRMFVMSNGGGGIFSHIKPTRGIPGRERWYNAPMNLPLRDLCRAYGFNYFKIDGEDGLERQFDAMMHTPRMLAEVITDGPTDASLYLSLMEFLKNNRYVNT